MKFSRLPLLLLVFPLTVVLDFLVFSMLRSCPTCGSFSQFVTSEGALSFPIVVEISQWVRQLIPPQKK